MNELSEFRNEGDKIIHDSICKLEGSSAKTRTVISGRFDSAYKIESKSTYERRWRACVSHNDDGRKMVGGL